MISCDNGFQEALGLVSDASVSATRFCAVTGYIEVFQGTASPQVLQFLGVGSAISGREVLVRHPDSERGAVRFLSLDGPPLPLDREGAQAWDHGGIFDVNIRAFDDLDAVHAAFGAQGFQCPAPVTDWDFGALAVREVVERDADGICVAAMQRVYPPLEGYAGIGGATSWIFNSTQIVPDFEAARHLFVDALGWLPVQETQGYAAAQDGANCMGFPPGLAPKIPMKIGIYHPHGRMEGSVEVIAFDCGGRDFRGVPRPGRGWAGLRFAVTDIDAIAARMAGEGCTLSQPVSLEWRPHGLMRALACMTPWGARFEFFQAA
ncbi:hypothetical protein [Novosphingobium mangrovi (ex Hu et al. 2023)]|uniref:VOC domain-containing protein n=1 Tax=Novosphingobium mangrovi (ex Hu et al. 2023) TaxID=2930094 RepID=A0ABT0AFF4_9SPHN|nr:hypothetical protein [Novosphingobium mangrovi (ex Hu et al. 2023)]MCJ1961917.1 hypothetical protein [Novosphingobium mangrovi (ex Hu et al. 2023)]